MPTISSMLRINSIWELMFLSPSIRSYIVEYIEPQRSILAEIFSDLSDILSTKSCGNGSQMREMLSKTMRAVTLAIEIPEWTMPIRRSMQAIAFDDRTRCISRYPKEETVTRLSGALDSSVRSTRDSTRWSVREHLPTRAKVSSRVTQCEPATILAQRDRDRFGRQISTGLLRLHDRHCVTFWTVHTGGCTGGGANRIGLSPSRGLHTSPCRDYDDAPPRTRFGQPPTTPNRYGTSREQDHCSGRAVPAGDIMSKLCNR